MVSSVGIGVHAPGVMKVRNMRASFQDVHGITSPTWALPFPRCDASLCSVTASKECNYCLFFASSEVTPRWIENGFRNYPRFRNCDSETIWTDSETIWTDSETAIQKLLGPIQKLFAPKLGRFRNYDSETISSDSETISPDSETTIQKLFRPIQKLFRPVQKL